MECIYIEEEEEQLYRPAKYQKMENESDEEDAQDMYFPKFSCVIPRSTEHYERLCPLLVSIRNVFSHSTSMPYFNYILLRNGLPVPFSSHAPRISSFAMRKAIYEIYNFVVAKNMGILSSDDKSLTITCQNISFSSSRSNKMPFVVEK
jgi:hypothetical protein